MEKRHILGAAAAFVLLIAWWVWVAPRYAPPPTPVPAEPRTAGEPSQGEGPPPGETTAPAVVPPPAPAAADAAAPVGPPTAAAAEELVEVDTDLFHVVLTNRGARARSWRLKRYEDHHGQPLEVIGAGPRAPALPLGVDLDDPALARTIDAALFQVARQGGEAGAQTLTFTWSDGRGLRVQKALTFRPGQYRVGVSLSVEDRGRRIPARLTWGPGFQTHDPKVERGSFYYAHQVVRRIDRQVLRTGYGSLERGTTETPAAALDWAGLEDQYFAALLLPAGGDGQVRMWPVRQPRREGTLPMVAVGVPPEGADLFVGPKRHEVLRAAGGGLEDVIWFSSYAMLQFLAKYLFLALVWVYEHVSPNYGVAIILATVALRVLLFPLNQYSMVSMRRASSQMQQLQPKINAIKARYKKIKDPQARQKMNEDIMALYRREGVNPLSSMSGCLPMLIQFPILIAFYNVFTVAIELRGAPFFGWIQDLSVKDPWFVTPVLMGATMFLQQKMSMSAAMDPAQRNIMLFMPLVFTVMFLNLPSGLILYWLVNNVLGIAQQWLVNRHVGRLEPASQKA